MQSREASPGGGVSRKHAIIAGLTIAAIAAHLLLRYADRTPVTVSTDSVNTYDIPLFVALLLGGTPLVWDLLVKLFNRQFGSDLLAGISIVTSVVLGEYSGRHTGGPHAVGWGGARRVRGDECLVGASCPGQTDAVASASADGRHR